MNALGDIQNIIMKTLLSAPPQNFKIGDISSMDLIKKLMKEEEERGSTKLSNYLQKLCGQTESINTIELDHNYSKPWNWRADNTYAKPLKSLFISKQNKFSTKNTAEAYIDIVNDFATPKPAYDEERARKLMDEPLKQVRLLRADVGDVDWEFNVDRKDWSHHQVKLFDKGCKILHLDRMSRLSYSGNWNEPVLRRLAIDKSARRLRTLFSTYGWKYQLIRWLHFLWLDILHHEYLVGYIEILQTLKKKVPALLERLIFGVPQTTKANCDILYMMLQSQWDPSSIALPCHTPRRLPGNPILLIVPCGSSSNNLPNTRLQRWHSHLSAVGTVMIVNTNKSNMSKVSVTNSLEHLLASTRAKIAEIKSDYIGRSIILIGLNSGAALACQIALVEPVSAVICLGFPMYTVEEKRGQPDDSILGLSVPTMFVVGQHASTSSINDMEDLRERLRVHTALVVVGAADDFLRISHSKLTADGMTQSMVDKCIIDEVSDFIGCILLTPNHNKHDSRSANVKPRMKFIERKRKISVNEDQHAPKKRLSLSSSQSGLTLNVNTINRTKKSTSSRNLSRHLKWANERDGKSSAVSRKNHLDDKSLIARASLDGIRIINKNVSFKTHPVSLLGSEDCIGDSNFVGQLTADRLLEMPVIIAQEDNSNNGNSSIINNTTHQQMQSVKLMLATSGSTISREDSSTKEVRQASVRCVPSSTKTSTIHIGRAAAKALNSSTSLVNNKPDDKLRNPVTKCATIYFRDQPSMNTQAQLHKVDLISRAATGNNQQSNESNHSTTIGRKNFVTQLISRSRPPRIKNIPAVKHFSTELPTNGPQ